MSRLPSLALLTLLSTGCIVGSGEPAKELRSVGAYDSVRTSDCIDVRLSAELPAGELEVRCDDNLIDLIDTSVKGGELVVRVRGQTGVAPKTTCEVTTGRWDLRGLHTSGSGDIRGEGPFFGLRELSTSGSGDIHVQLRMVDEATDDEATDDEDTDDEDTGAGLVEGEDGGDGFVESEDGDEALTDTEPAAAHQVPDNAHRLELRTSGSGDAHISGVEADTVRLRTSGSGDVYVGGSAASLNAESSGSGDISAKDLRAERGVLQTSGSADIRATVTERVEARSSGSGDITVWGRPDRRSQNSTGSGDVRFR